MENCAAAGVRNLTPPQIWGFYNCRDLGNFPAPPSTSRADPALAALFYPAHPFARFYAAQKRALAPTNKDKMCKKMYHILMKRYNMVEAAKQLSVTRQTIYYWIKKGWVKPKRDYRDFPVFTDADIRNLKKWKEKLVTP